MSALLVIVGAAVGAPARFLVALLVPGVRATLLVNVLGSFLLGLVVGSGAAPYALLGVGFCGAFTTFSAYAVEAVELPRRVGLGYAVASVLLCLGAAALGLWVSPTRS